MSAPEKKRKRLNAALAEAIGVKAKKSEENIEKPIALALISDNQSAAGLLGKIQAQHRPKEVLEACLNVCQQKGEEALVGEAFRSLFANYFQILGIDTAQNTWNLLSEALKISKSSNEITIVGDFVSKANLLGNGFSKLVQVIKSDMAEGVRSFWESRREEDSRNLAYSLICLVLAENAYVDEVDCEPIEFWNEKIFVEDMKKDATFAFLYLLANGQESSEKWVKKLLKNLDLAKHKTIPSIFLNHVEFFTTILEDAQVIELLKSATSPQENAKSLRNVARRLRFPGISAVLTTAVLENFEEIRENLGNPMELLRDSDDFEDFNIEDAKKIEELVAFLAESIGIIEGKEDVLKILSLLTILSTKSPSAERLLETYAKNSHFSKFVKKVTSSKTDDEDLPPKNLKISKILKKIRKLHEKEVEKYVEGNGEQVTEALETGNLENVIQVLKTVHNLEVKKEIFESLTKFVEEIEGGKDLLEIELYKIIVQIYSNSHLETLAVQLVLARLGSDEWAEKSESEQNWFDSLVKVVELMDLLIKDAKNSIIKGFSAIYCHIFTQLLRNVQKYVKMEQNAKMSRTFSEDEEYVKVLRSHKLIQDIGRVVDSMKRHESYFAMLAASIISDTVFNGSSTILVMAKLHSLADKNASALLATNLPVVERTRYSKFLPIITKASKRVY